MDLGVGGAATNSAWRNDPPRIYVNLTLQV